MFTRILSSTLAAAALVTAAPALAADGAAPATSHECSCCSDPSAMRRHHEATRATDREQAAPASAKSAPRTGDEDPSVRNQSFGG